MSVNFKKETVTTISASVIRAGKEYVLRANLDDKMAITDVRLIKYVGKQLFTVMSFDTVTQLVLVNELVEKLLTKLEEMQDEA